MLFFSPKEVKKNVIFDKGQFKVTLNALIEIQTFRFDDPSNTLPGYRHNYPIE